MDAHPELAEELRVRFDALRFVDMAVSGAPVPPVGTPRRIGEYRILREVGRGGMGVVYEAEQASMDRVVALKVLSPAATGIAEAVERFQREARAAGRLQHSNIVPIHAMGEDQGYWFYAMEMVRGQSLGEVITELKERTRETDPSGNGHRRPGTVTRGLERFRGLASQIAGVAEALQVAHREGIVHRDVKPTNLLVAEDGTLKLVDFGLAHLEGIDGAMTRTGQLLGTPHYMSPEQAQAKRIPIDHRTDVYSLGATLYEALTLRLPFPGDSLQEVYSQIATVEPTFPRKVDARIPRDLETIVLKAMEKERDRRYQSAEKMARDLRRFTEGVPILARRVGPVARAWRKVRRNKVRATLIAAVAVLAIVGTIFALHARRQAEARRALEYLELLGRADGAIPGSIDPRVLSKPEERRFPGETPGEIYTRAIALLPERPEAWFSRALAPGRTLDERLADLDAAAEHGLPEQIRLLARAWLRRASGEMLEPGVAAPLDDPRADTVEEAFFLGRLLAADRKREEARRLLTRAIEASEPGSVLRYRALRCRASLRGEDGDLDEALEDLLALVTLGDDSVEVRITLAFTWRRLGNEGRASSLFLDAIEKARRTGSPEEWQRLCARCRSIGEHEWHERATEEAVAACPDSSGVLLERALARLEQEGLDRCRQAIEVDPEDPVAHRILGRIYIDRGEYAKAVASLGRASGLDPGSAKIRGMLGEALGRLGKKEEALRAVDDAIELDPRFGMAHKARGGYLEALGRPEEAVQAYRRAIECLPTYLMVHLRLWSLLRRLGRPDEARQEVERAAAWDGSGAGGHHLRAFALSELGRYEGALAEIEGAIRIHAKATFLLEFRAGLLADLGRFDEAFERYDEILAWRPTSWTYRGRACAHLELCRFEEALSDFEDAARLGADDPTIKAQTSFALAGLGRFEDASVLLGPFDERHPWAESRLVWQARTLCLMGRYEEALQAAEALAVRRPDRVFWKAWSLRALGRGEEARRIVRGSIAGEPDPHLRIPFAWMCAVAGEGERAVEILDSLTRPWTPTTRYERAAVHAVLGDAKSAHEWFESAVGAGYRRPSDAPPDPDFGTLER